MSARAPLIVSCVTDGDLVGDRSAPLVPWWSVGKTSLAACALLLVADGRLDLDRPAHRRGFTLRQLLQHTSGLDCYTERTDYTSAVDRREQPWHEHDLLTSVDNAPPLFDPGQGWCYSNTGYFLVRRLIEQATGADIEAALKTLVFAPLGISNARLARDRADLRQCVWGHEDEFHPGWVYSGLLIGPAEDAAMLMHRLFTGALLPASLHDVMRERRALDVLPDRPWRSAGYGLGLMIDIASPLGVCIGHTGQGPDSVAAVYHFPDLDPPRTVAAFAPTDDQAVAECAVLEAAAAKPRRSPQAR
jgi:D-alanyl-D-alanine carboxypeptidase